MKFISETDFTEILNSIRELIDKKNQGALLNLLIDLHPADVADLLADLKKDERKYLFPLLPTEKASAVLTELDPPIVDQLLEDVSEQALVGAFLQSEGLTQRRLDRYLSVWRTVQAETDGTLLRRRGLPPGPRYREILRLLRNARLDGEITTSEEEARMLDTLLADLPKREERG